MAAWLQPPDVPWPPKRPLSATRWAQNSLAAAKAALSSDFTPITDFRAGADYRQAVAANLLDRLYMQTTSAAVPTEVHGL